jgi:hypothetical protein
MSLRKKAKAAAREQQQSQELDRAKILRERLAHLGVEGRIGVAIDHDGNPFFERDGLRFRLLSPDTDLLVLEYRVGRHTKFTQSFLDLVGLQRAIDEVKEKQRGLTTVERGMKTVCDFFTKW